MLPLDAPITEPCAMRMTPSAPSSLAAAVIDGMTSCGWGVAWLVSGPGWRIRCSLHGAVAHPRFARLRR